MQLQQAQQPSQSVQMVSTWLGYNHNLRINSGQFYDMNNMTSDYYPLLSPRDKRGYLRTFTNLRYLGATDKLYWVDGSKFYYDGAEVMTVDADTDKQIVQMGAWLCIFPDGKAYNTYDGTIKTLDSEFTSSENPFITICKNDGTQYDDEHMWAGDTEPTDLTTYTMWLDTSSNPIVLKQWSENESQWVSVPTVYVKIEAEGIGAHFNADDAVKISGCDNDDFNASMVIQSIDDDFIVVIGIIPNQFVNSQPMTFERKAPSMDFVCELNNRLWGCSSENHEIYASKLGDPTNWNYFGGLASDSYAVTVGSNGDFTGMVAHLGYVLAFKENGVHKVYGSMPSTYVTSFTELRGVEKGSERSLVVINEALFYKAKGGIVMYDGSLPQSVSDAFGTEVYYDAVAGSYENKYIVSMRDRDYIYHLWVYDTAINEWHKEDAVMAIGFAVYDGGCYMADKEQRMWVFPDKEMNNYLFPDMEWDDAYYYPSEELYPGYTVSGIEEDDVEWMCETGDIGLDNPYNKYISRVVLRMVLEEGARLDIDVMYDSDDMWENIFNLIADGKRSYTLPIRVNRCDHFRLRLSGKGKLKIYSMAYSVETGSEI